MISVDPGRQRLAVLGRHVGQRPGLGGDVLGEDPHERLTLERHRAAEHLVHDDAHRVDVGAVVDVLAQRLLRGHVERRAEDGAGAGEVVVAVGPGHLGDAEVEQLGDVLALGGVGDEDVLRLHVPVNDALLVRGGQPVAGLDQDVDEPLGRLRLLDEIAQRSPVQELHGQVDAVVRQLAEVFDRDDVAVADGGGGARLLAEASHRLLVGEDLAAQELDRDALLDVDVLGGIHLAHAALTEPLGEPVAPVEHLSDHRIRRHRHPRPRTGGSLVAIHK